MMRLSEIFDECLKLKQGDTEIVLGHKNGVWRVALGNDDPSCSLIGNGIPQMGFEDRPIAEVAAMTM